jgi:hypothetical protein
MASKSFSLRFGSMVLALGATGLFTMSGAQASVVEEAPVEAVEVALPVEAVESVDQTEVPELYDMAETTDAVMPILAIDPVVEEPVEAAIFTDTLAEAVEDSAGESVTEVPVEWVMRDVDPVIMYSMAGAGGIDDPAEEVASRAAEQAASRSLDQIDASLPEDAPLN